MPPVVFVVNNPATTRLERLMAAFSERSGQPRHSLRFMFDGHYLNPRETVAAIEMEDGDEIWVGMEQVGD